MENGLEQGPPKAGNPVWTITAQDRNWALACLAHGFTPGAQNSACCGEALRKYCKIDDEDTGEDCRFYRGERKMMRYIE